jgi:hypothetical protein
MKKLTGVIFILSVISVTVLSSGHADSVEILVRTKDGPGGRRKGDIVCVKESPAKWGGKEGPPDYVIVKIPGIKAENFRRYHIRHGKLRNTDPDETAERVRSRYRFDLDNMPAANEGIITTGSIAAVSNLIDRRAEILASRNR